jgi:hypothetical protein
MKIEVKIKGVSPLIMHKYVIVEDTASKRGKKIYVPEEEAEKVAYRNSEGKLCLPTAHFKAAMVKAATDFVAKGKKTYKDFIKSGLMFDEVETVLDQQEYEVYSCSVVVSRSRILRSRPRINNWSCSFVIELTDEMWLNQSIVKEILESAGKYKGVGDNRPEFGRFEVAEFKKIE